MCPGVARPIGDHHRLVEPYVLNDARREAVRCEMPKVDLVELEIANFDVIGLFHT
jgi:hypothetical protein